ncbi:hypothetical protein C2E25_17090 [Geothermobacter hydrogeniphilus]|uniref:Uncharacterized protein n=1 Tax=Geothermobacter hydrogeniphilus TaxID=1969733 RepID=A0A2K2H5K7_9BACT|nr:tetratricopeptide repeat protein [Geothermobacter hydrogeniphilus]PNU18541.1 hypothetical protein C2E25_17090 [Geothermobacter hydrogeniphilus]
MMRFVKPVFAPFLLLVAVLLVYGRSLDIPWYFDDIQNIVENPVIRNFTESLGQLLQPRGLVGITFAINYHFGLTDPAGYHLVNIFLHFLVTCLVWWILSRWCAFSRSVALCGALLFALHPIQTQAVDYIVQRSVLLAALLSLASIALFLAAEDAAQDDCLAYSHGYSRILWLTALLLAAIAVLTKQNTATLPALIFLFANYRYPQRWRKQLLRLLPFLIAPLAVFVKQVILPSLAGADLSVITTVRELGTMQGVTPLNYFVTELSVLFLYVKMLLWPIGLRLEYAYPVITQPFTLGHALLFGAHLAILAGAFFSRKRFRALFLAVFWFYLALFVESSFLPLDPVFEHRLYLPLVGLTVLFCAVLEKVTGASSRALILPVVLLLVLGVMSWQRNELWRDPIAFSEDNVRKSPHSEGALVALAGRYLEAGRLEEALAASQRALAINPDYFRIYINLSSIYLDRQSPLAARRAALAGLLRVPDNVKLRKNLAISYLQTGQAEEGRMILRELLHSSADYSLRVLMARSYIDAKNWIAAEQELQRAIAMGVGRDALPYYLLGITQYEQRKLKPAAAALRAALAVNPNDEQALSGLGFILLEQGNSVSAREVAGRLKSFAPESAAALLAAIRQRVTP